MTETRLRALLISALFAAAPLLTATSALAGPKECVAAADEGQKLRDDGKLTVAREKFIACAAKTCPGVIAKQCSQWLADAERDLPSVTFRALDEQGKETLAVRVVVDGVAVSQSIEARALPIDPGEHLVRFETAEGRSVEDKIVVRPGEKNRIVEISFQIKTVPGATVPAKAEAPPKVDGDGGGFQIPVLGWVGLGVMVVGGGMTALFAISANNEEKDLRSTCAPSCSSSDESSLDTKLLLANVGLGVGIAGLGLAVVSTILANTGEKPAKAAIAQRRTFDFGVAPGAVMMRGAF